MMDNEQLPKGYKNTEVGLIPEDWEVHSLFDEIDTLVAGVSVNSVNEKIDIIHDIAILKTSCVSKGSFYPSEAKKIITSDINRAKHNPKKDHIIISRMNTPDLVGECGYVEADFPNLYLPDRLWMMEFKKASNINSRWLNYILNTYVFRQKIRELGSGTSGSMKNISKSKLLELLIPYPDGAEQTAIATALSDADALINSLEKLIAKKRNIKQGAMQQLLKPKEGWEVKKLGDLITYKNGKSFESFIDENGEYYLITLNSIDIKGELKKEHLRVKEFDNSLEKGDLVMVLSDVAHGNFLGLTDVIPENNKYVLNQRMGALKNLRGVTSRFLSIYINHFQSYFKLSGKGSSQQNLGKDDILKFEIHLPSLDEQNEISTILSDMDAEIQALETKLEKYRKIKLGMMQNLLTGKIRLV